MSDANAKNAADNDLTESLLNADVEEQVIIDEELAPTWTRGEKQPSMYRDVGFAILFYAQFLVVLGLAIVWGFPSLKYQPYGTGETVEFSGVMYLCLISSAVALGISVLALTFMTKFAQFLVQFSILFSVFCSLLMVLIFGYQGNDGAALAAFIFFAISAFWAWRVWGRIPFAVTNLTTALSAVRSNLGVSFVAYGLAVAAFGWTCIWMLSLIGVYVRSADCSQGGTCQGGINAGVVILFLLSFYWTQQVIKNMIHVTVSGVVGTWWFDPTDASSLCSNAIMDSFVRSATFSFGSVCLGSLLVAVVQTVRHIVENARRHARDGVGMCILDCLLGFLEQIVDYFNKWAYVYVGLYGYSYLEAGHNVTSLFAQRGWTTIINDDMIMQVLSLMSMVIGGLTGCVSLAVAAAHKTWVSEFPDKASLWVPFLTGFLIGCLMASILMSVVASAVDTVIVCFAEAPQEFQANHGALSEQMVRAWRQTHPQEFVYPRGALAEQTQTDDVYAAPIEQDQVPLTDFSVDPNEKSDSAPPL